MPWTKKVKPGQKISLGFNGRFEADGEAPQTVTKTFVGEFNFVFYYTQRKCNLSELRHKGKSFELLCYEILK